MRLIGYCVTLAKKWSKLHCDCKKSRVPITFLFMQPQEPSHFTPSYPPTNNANFMPTFVHTNNFHSAFYKRMSYREKKMIRLTQLTLAACDGVKTAGYLRLLMRVNSAPRSRARRSLFAMEGDWYARPLSGESAFEKWADFSEAAKGGAHTRVPVNVRRQQDKQSCYFIGFFGESSDYEEGRAWGKMWKERKELHILKPTCPEVIALFFILFFLNVISVIKKASVCKNIFF